MLIVKLAIEECTVINKKSDGSPMYLLKVLGNRGRGKDGDYLKDVCLFTDEKTYKKIDCGDDDVILKFTGEKSVKG